MTRAPPLASHQVFRSLEFEEIQQSFRQTCCKHELHQLSKDQTWGWLNAVELKHVGVSAMAYGTDVQMILDEIDDTYFFILPYSGSLIAEINTTQLSISPGKSCTLNPTDSVKLTWKGDCSAIVVRIDKKSLEQKLRLLIDIPIRQNLQFIHFNDTTTRYSNWWRHVYTLLEELEATADAARPSFTLNEMESLLLTALLESLPHTYSDAIREYKAGFIAPGHVRRVERYIEENADQDLSITDLVQVSGVSARALFENFRRFRSTSPMAQLRLVRLRRVHQALITASPHESVSEIAVRWGFHELGRFAMQYRNVFGESPSITLRNSRK